MCYYLNVHFQGQRVNVTLNSSVLMSPNRQLPNSTIQDFPLDPDYYSPCGGWRYFLLLREFDLLKFSIELLLSQFNPYHIPKSYFRSIFWYYFHIHLSFEGSFLPLRFSNQNSICISHFSVLFTTNWKSVSSRFIITLPF